MKCMYYIICVCLDQCRNTVHVRICLSGLISDYICHMELVGASVITFHRNVGMCTRIDIRTCVGWNFLDQMPGYCKYHEICQIKCQYILQTHEICQIKRDSWCQEICPNICRICMYSMFMYVYIYIYVRVRVNLHMFEHVYTYIHMSDCISEHMSNVRPDRCGNTWKGKRPNMCRNLCRNVRICTCQHVCQDVYTKGGDLNSYRRVFLLRSSRNTDIKNM